MDAFQCGLAGRVKATSPLRGKWPRGDFVAAVAETEIRDAEGRGSRSALANARREGYVGQEATDREK